MFNTVVICLLPSNISSIQIFFEIKKQVRLQLVMKSYEQRTIIIPMGKQDGRAVDVLIVQKEGLC